MARTRSAHYPLPPRALMRSIISLSKKKKVLHATLIAHQTQVSVQNIDMSMRYALTVYDLWRSSNLFILAPLAVRSRSALLKDTLLFELFQLTLLNTCALLGTGSSNTGLVSVVLDKTRQDTLAYLSSLSPVEKKRITYLDVSAERVVPPPETGREARRESGMVEVVVVGTGPKGNKVSKRPREVVARVSVNRLPKTKSDPNVDGEDVKVIPEYSVQEWSRDRSLREDQNFKRMSILGGLQCI